MIDYLKNISTRNWIIIAAVILVIILIIYFSTRKKTITTTITEPAIQPANNSGSGNDNFPLRLGSRGANVSKWQAYVNSKGGKLTVDGIWGPLTEADSLKWTGFNSITEQYFNTVVK